LIPTDAAWIGKNLMAFVKNLRFVGATDGLQHYAAARANGLFVF